MPILFNQVSHICSYLVVGHYKHVHSKFGVKTRTLNRFALTHPMALLMLLSYAAVVSDGKCSNYG